MTTPTTTGATAHHQDTVAAAFGALGTPVDCTGLRSLALEGPHVLWLLAAGEMDLFAVDAQAAGPWHHLGRLAPGSLLLGPAPGPRHTLVARPGRDCVLRRIALRELQWTEQDGWSWYGTGEPGPLEQSFALGAGRGLRVLCQTPDDVLGMHVPAGSVRYGAAYEGYADGTLLIDPTLWQGMVEQQHRLLYAVDRWIEELERAHEDRAAAGIAAGEAARAGADRTLLASIGGPGRRGRRAAAGADATYAACRLVAEADGIERAEPAEAAEPPGAALRHDPVARIALASRVRTRTVRLTGPWWQEDTGPLVGHREDDAAPVALLWRRGGYEAVDPATGSRERIGRHNHDHYAPRAVMFYRPLPDGRVTLRTLLRFGLRGSGRELRGIALGVLVAVGLGALVPVATGKVLGVYVPRAETGLIVQTGLALVAAAVVSAAFMLLQNTGVLRLEGRVEAALQPAVWDRLLRLPAAFFAGRSTGELAGAAMGISAIRRTVSGIAPVLLQAGTVGAVNLVLLLVYSVPLALVALAMLLAIAAVFLGLGWWQLRHQRRLVALSHKLDNQAFQTLRGLPKLRVAAAESFAYAAWAKEFARTRELQQRIGRLKNTVTVLNAVCLPLCTLVLFVLLAGPARGSLTAGDFLTFSTSVTMLLTSVTQLTGALLSAAAVQPMYEQLRPILQAHPETRSGDAPPGELTGALEARDLSFRYADEGPLVLDGVCLRIHPGEFVAIVGASGCGKSTLLRLLIGLDTPTSGTVLYDGQDLAALDRSAVRRQCGVVLQNAQPFAGSILECIGGAETYSPEEAWEAAALAGLAEDIKAMPMGLHTMLSEGGGTISGGQRQRLMIAQALVRKPRLLFLDEATSALDNEAQRIVIESTRALRATRVVVAHRLSTVMDADRVLVMSEGRVVQEGTPAELLADEGGPFRELVRRQME
ncbi:NHLP bacteriocin export ABC transporter permease/ATPase subunit [Streptomyces luteosporeus]|uniref:NHLP bacteriocin export ABC transporter permease/ATPase subunit n=1 Tax=Streptomyces luteosporeus TaxID=173856 RepID=A0ABP6GEL6_9ACTN